ncbi:hypothetical protein RLEG12_02600 (plasmid) [Rhizobium leguminosarum bv. trifolii CB782]|nr:hypothetical protein RLEG12_02600 [Rhizobium leguminosarum bv. trifolii CB782]
MPALLGMESADNIRENHVSRESAMLILPPS